MSIMKEMEELKRLVDEFNPVEIIDQKPVIDLDDEEEESQDEIYEYENNRMDSDSHAYCQGFLS